MASNSISSHRVDAAVQGFLADAGQSDEMLVAHQIPEVKVDAKRFSGILYSMPPAAYLGDGARIANDSLKMSAQDPFPEIHADYTPTKNIYECVARGAKPRRIADREAARWDFPIQMLEQWTFTTRRTVNLAFEYDSLVNQIFATGNWPDVAVGALTGGAQVAWDVATSSPIQDGLAMRDLIRAGSGVYPDYGFVTYDVLQALRIHRETLGVFGTNAQGLVAVANAAPSDDAVLRFYADKWRLPGGLFCSQALYNSANSGQSTTIAEVASAQVWMGCKRGVSGGGLREGGVALLGQGPVSVVRVREYDLTGYRWRAEDPAGEYVAVDHSYTYVRPSDTTNTAYLLTGVVT